jgi:protein-disulfide isomerase
MTTETRRGRPLLKTSVLLTIAALSAVLVLAVGCGGGGGGGEARALFELAPGSASGFEFLDLEALREHDDLRMILVDVEGRLEELEDQFNIDADDVAAGAIITIDGDDNLIITGDLNRQDLVDALEDEDFEEDEIEGVTVWEGSGYYEAVAFLAGGRYAFGYHPEYAEDIVDNSRGKGRSLADDEDISAIFDQLVGSGDPWYVLVGENCFLSGCRALGASSGRLERYVASNHVVLLFSSEEDAKEAEDQVEDVLMEGARNIDIRQEGQLVEARFEADVEEEEELPPTPRPTPAASPAVQATPTPIVVEVSVDDDPSWGPEDAPVTIVEFSEFLCPYCLRFAVQTLPQIKQAYEGKVRYVYRDFIVHGEPAMKISEATECADDQEKFWEYHDHLWENYQTLGQQAQTGVDALASTLKGYASDLGLDTATFDDCLDTGKHTAEVQKDSGDARAYGVRGTPGFFINGQSVPGAQPFNVFQQVIDAALEEAEAG